jgi:hypothetical protein
MPTMVMRWILAEMGADEDPHSSKDLRLQPPADSERSRPYSSQFPDGFVGGADWQHLDRRQGQEQQGRHLAGWKGPRLNDLQISSNLFLDDQSGSNRGEKQQSRFQVRYWYFPYTVKWQLTHSPRNYKPAAGSGITQIIQIDIFTEFHWLMSQSLGNRTNERALLQVRTLELVLPPSQL